MARLVTTDAAASTLKPAADGQLPNLQLAEGDKKDAADAKTRTVHPALLFGAVLVSVVMTLWLVAIDFNPSPAPSAGRKAQARREIREWYFGGGSLDSGELTQYQIWLRDAELAHSRRDYKTERMYYRKVLDMLRAEPAGREHGLTGSRTRDQDLEEWIVILLSEK